MKQFFGLAITSIFALGIATNAMAADMPLKAAPMMAAPVYSWTGFYIGGNGGYGWDDIKTVESTPASVAFPTGTVFPVGRGSGWLAGVQAGYNYQIAPNFLFGVEGEYLWADIRDTSVSISTVPRFLGFASTNTTKYQDIALATARLGYVANEWLFYGKGGLAWGESTSSGFGMLANGTLNDTFTKFSSHTGWVVGVGVEWSFAPNWSAKIEYDHIFFDSRNIAVNDTTVAGVSSVTVQSSGTNLDLVRAGINYRFNWGAPLVARY